MVSFKEFLILDAAPLEESDPKSPGRHDRVSGFERRPEESYEATPSRRRKSSRANRRLKAAGYTHNKTNAAGYPSEDEMEQKMPAQRERTKHFANQFDREVIQKGGQDALTSQPGSKRHYQRKARDERRFDGREDEMEQKMPANRDRNIGHKNAEPYASREAQPTMKRQIQAADRYDRSQLGNREDEMEQKMNHGRRKSFRDHLNASREDKSEFGDAEGMAVAGGPSL